MFCKTIEELELKDVKCNVIYEDSSLEFTFDGIDIKAKNIKEWLLYEDIF